MPCNALLVALSLLSVRQETGVDVELADLCSPGWLPACCAMQVKSLEQLEALLGPEAEAVEDMKRLFALAEGYGYADWLVLDASVVRGLAYYTGGWAELRRFWLGAGCTGAGKGLDAQVPA